MKWLYCLIIVAGLQVTLYSQLGWYQQTSGTSEDLYSVCFIDQNVGWAAGTNGIILNTTDGGENWIQQISGTNKGLSSICFTNQNNGWAVGGYGTIVKTTDGGSNWVIQTSGTSEHLASVYFTDENNGWCVGWDGTIYNSTDGGINWEIQFSDTTYEFFTLTSIYFIDQNNGWAGGGGFDSSLLNYYAIILKTSDGGINWSSQTVLSFGPFASVYFINHNYGWAAGGFSVFKTTDGGLNWQNCANIEGFPHSIFFIDENIGWAVGDDPEWQSSFILNSIDSGESWTTQFSITIPPKLRSVYFADHNNGWVVGDNGSILQTTTGGIIPVELTSFTTSTSQGKVTLNWSTATETNNSGFEIERKQDDNNWETIGFVAGHGTRTEPQQYSHIDNISNINSNSLAYRLKQIDFDGSFEYSDVVNVDNLAPTDFILYQNSPNPFNPTTTIEFSLPVKSQVELVIYNSLGEEVVQLVNELKEAGKYTTEFNASNLPSGIYLYRLQAGEFVQVRKMILLK